ncbi:hypothetical protein GCM10008085_13120 [Winogradskyella epiphytica]|nr:hypothetical protein GCM10008085_13120 [Winogradskyella epiphytica]
MKIALFILVIIGAIQSFNKTYVNYLIVFNKMKETNRLKKHFNSKKISIYLLTKSLSVIVNKNYQKSQVFSLKQ